MKRVFNIPAGMRKPYFRARAGRQPHGYLRVARFRQKAAEGVTKITIVIKT